MVGEKRLAVFGIVSASIVGLGCVFVIIAGGLYRGDLRASQGSLAPEIVSRDVDNQALKLSGLRGGFVLVYFTPDLSDSIDTAYKSGSTGDEAKTQQIARQTSNTSRFTDLKSLNQLSRALDAQQVTVLESRRYENAGPMNLISLVAQGNETGEPTVRDSAGRHLTHMLFDADGDIARRFKVDAVATQSTLFVIDATGVIRYRGTCEQAAANFAGTSMTSRQISLGTANVLNATAIGHLPTIDGF